MNGEAVELTQSDSANSEEGEGYRKNSSNPNKYSMIDQGIKLIKLIPYGFRVPDSYQINREFSILLRHRLGYPILQHLEEFHAFTYLELERLLNAKKSDVWYVVNAMRILKMVKVATKIKKYGKSIGNAPKVWIEVGADPKYSAEAIQRYYKSLKQARIKNGEIVDLEPIITTLDELHLERGLTKHNSDFNLIKSYLPEISPKVLIPAYAEYQSRRMGK